MQLDIITKLQLGWVALNLCALLTAVAWITVPRVQSWRRMRKARKYLRRDADGKLYVEDPQTGAFHDLEKLMTERAVRKLIGDHPEISPRQMKKAKRQIRQQRAARVAAAAGQA